MRETRAAGRLTLASTPRGLPGLERNARVVPSRGDRITHRSRQPDLGAEISIDSEFAHGVEPVILVSLCGCVQCTHQALALGLLQRGELAAGALAGRAEPLQSLRDS